MNTKRAVKLESALFAHYPVVRARHITSPPYFLRACPFRSLPHSSVSAHHRPYTTPHTMTLPALIASARDSGRVPSRSTIADARYRYPAALLCSALSLSKAGGLARCYSYKLQPFRHSFPPFPSSLFSPLHSIFSLSPASALLLVCAPVLVAIGDSGPLGDGPFELLQPTQHVTARPLL